MRERGEESTEGKVIHLGFTGRPPKGIRQVPGSRWVGKDTYVTRHRCRPMLSPRARLEPGPGKTACGAQAEPGEGRPEISVRVPEESIGTSPGQRG